MGAPVMLTDLPVEVLVEIFQNDGISCEDLFSIHQTCNYLRGVVTTRSLWTNKLRKVCVFYFPKFLFRDAEMRNEHNLTFHINFKHLQMAEFGNRQPSGFRSVRRVQEHNKLVQDLQRTNTDIEPHIFRVRLIFIA